MPPPPTLATKLYVPPPPPKVVSRPRLIERLNEGSGRKLTLISAAAGFGKSTVVSEWIAGCGRQTAWLSLDQGDSDPKRFLTYLIAALQTISPDTGAGVLGALQAPQPPSAEAILTALLNEVADIPDDFMLVLDDYHLIDARAVDDALNFLLENLPPRMHLVIATREDPQLPLARLRARGQLTELRASDLRFTPDEAAEFLKSVMGLDLSPNDVAALETRTEGWIAGLQLAAISLRGDSDTTGFIKSFTGSHHFVLDYLLTEVLQKQSESIQGFLLRTSVLDRLCGPLCDAVLLDPAVDGQETLEYLEHANLFIVPLDNERRWYRYHHLFGDLLRQRLQRSAPVSGEREAVSIAELHVRASQWYEDHGLEIEAFEHAAAAGDLERAARLMQGRGMPLHLRGALYPVLNWLESLPAPVLDERPMLWILYAGALTAGGQTAGVEQKLQAAEAALQGAEPDAETRDLLGRIANNRATLAISRYQADEAIAQAQRALELLRPENLPVRTITTWVLGVANIFKGDRAAAGAAFSEAITISQKIGHIFVAQLATTGLANVQEFENRLKLAAETYQHALELYGDQPLPFASEAHLGLTRIFYEWNDLETAWRHARQGDYLARQYSDIIDRFVVYEVLLARLKLAEGDVAGASEALAEASRSARQHGFKLRLPEIAAAQVLVLLAQDDPEGAARVAQADELPMSQARVLMAQGDPAAALALLEPLRRQMEEKDWADELLKVMVLQAVALHEHGDGEAAVRLLGEALALGEPGGFIRIFVDEGAPMAELLSETAARGIMPEYARRLLAEFDAEQHKSRPAAQPAQPLAEPLSQRELEVLQLIGQGLSNSQIGERLFLTVSTVKGHNSRIFDKLQVQRRTEAVARARELGLL